MTLVGYSTEQRDLDLRQQLPGLVTDADFKHTLILHSGMFGEIKVY